MPLTGNERSFVSKKRQGGILLEILWGFALLQWAEALPNHALMNFTHWYRVNSCGKGSGMARIAVTRGVLTCILDTVRKAARFAVYVAMITLQKNQKPASRILLDRALGASPSPACGNHALTGTQHAVRLDKVCLQHVCMDPDFCLMGPTQFHDGTKNCLAFSQGSLTIFCWARVP